MRNLIIIAVLLITVFGCTKQATDQLATEQSKKGGNHHPQTEVVAAMTLTHNADGTFSIDYGGATDVIQVLFRSGDSLSTISGNLNPTSVQKLIAPPIGSFTSYVLPNIYYQAVIVTGTWERDANGILGANWVFTYTNVVP